MRSPSEYSKGHIPGARNLPLFNDEERAIVGTLYKKQGKDKAVLEGLRFVGPKMASFIEQISTINPETFIGVHCWRGGQRSQSMAWLFERGGKSNVATLDKGYKAFRSEVLERFSALLKLRVLGGYTGSGKTEILAALKAHGEQVIDLEGLANHKGSAFGALGQGPQPTTEHFENLLWDTIDRLDPNKVIWIEDESRHVGSCRIHDVFFEQMRAAPTLFISIPQKTRVKRLVQDYGGFDAKQLEEPILKIQKRLGGQHVKSALEALKQGDLSTVAEITLNYYDKAYRYGLEQRDPLNKSELALDSLDADLIAKSCIEHVRNN